MDRLKRLDDAQLNQHVQRLERDVEHFRGRVEHEAAALERAGRCVLEDPLHHRLSSIHGFLKYQLKDLKTEVERRATATVVPKRWSLQSILRALVFRTMLRSPSLKRHPVRITP